MAKREAHSRAIVAGAGHATIKTVDVEDVPLRYLPGIATRIRAKALRGLRLAQ